MSLHELAIRTNVYQPKLDNGKETGLLEYVQQRTYADIRAQFEAVLQAVDIKEWECTALEAIEYISYGEYRQDETKLLPKGRLVVLAREGNCEGYRLELAIINDESVFVPIVSAKYLSNKDAVWFAARHIDNAIHNGLFGY